MISLRIDKDLRDSLDKFANENDLTRAQVVRRAIKSYIGKISINPDADLLIKDLKKGTCKRQPKIFTDEQFEEFWQLWPVGSNNRKVGKAKCKEKFLRLKDVAYKEIIDALQWQKDSDTWKDGFDPQPLTWINQRRWELPKQKRWYENEGE